MRNFEDQGGRPWRVFAVERTGIDYKGAFHLVFEGEAGRFELTEVRWNSLRTAERTLSTMSEVELRRRLRSARGRGALSS